MDNATGDGWKNIRSTFTPIFTSGKMKIMLKFIKQTGGFLTDDLALKAKSGEEMDLKESFGKFSLDALASCAFGVDAESFTNEKSVFVKYAKEVFETGSMTFLGAFIKLLPGASKFMEVFNINTFKPGPMKYFREVILKTLDARRKSKERRNDLIDLMLDCLDDDQQVEKENEDNQFDNDRKLSHDKEGAKITEDEVVATALVFLVAGYDTTGMTLSFLAYAMSKNPKIQEKLHEEIDQAFEDNNGELPDYNTIQNLPYVDMVFHETLRKYSPVGLNSRSCTKDYLLPGTDITIKKDDYISWSVSGLHHDPEHFSHPDEFWPEHFNKEEKAARNPYVSSQA
jgi:cytochrome P450